MNATICRLIKDAWAQQQQDPLIIDDGEELGQAVSHFSALVSPYSRQAPSLGEIRADIIAGRAAFMGRPLKVVSD